jgi:hypothetical protein
MKIHGTDEFKEPELHTAADLVNRTQPHELATGIQKFENYEYKNIIPANTWQVKIYKNLSS